LYLYEFVFILELVMQKLKNIRFFLKKEAKLFGMLCIPVYKNIKRELV